MFTFHFINSITRITTLFDERMCLEMETWSCQCLHIAMQYDTDKLICWNSRSKQETITYEQQDTKIFCHVALTCCKIYLLSVLFKWSIIKNGEYVIICYSLSSKSGTFPHATIIYCWWFSVQSDKIAHFTRHNCLILIKSYRF